MVVGTERRKRPEVWCAFQRAARAESASVSPSFRAAWDAKKDVSKSESMAHLVVSRCIPCGYLLKVVGEHIAHEPRDRLGAGRSGEARLVTYWKTTSLTNGVHDNKKSAKMKSV